MKMRSDNVCRSAGHTEGGVGMSENGYVYGGFLKWWYPKMDGL